MGSKGGWAEGEKKEICLRQRASSLRIDLCIWEMCAVSFFQFSKFAELSVHWAKPLFAISE